MAVRHTHSDGFSVRGHALYPRNDHHEPDVPGMKPPETLTDRELNRRLCKAGPILCPECESACGYGREYLRRKAAAG